jgi:hypothetical protein
MCRPGSIHHENLDLPLKKYLHLGTADHLADKAGAVDEVFDSLAYPVRTTLVIGLRPYIFRIFSMILPLL